METAFNTFANRADPDQAALTQAALVQVYYVCLWKYDVSDPTQLDLTSNLFVLYTNMKLFIVDGA